MRWGGVFWFWGALLAAILLVGALVFGFADPEPPLLFGGAVATMAILGALVWGRGLDRVDEDYLRAHPDVSPPIPWLGVSIGLLGFSLEVGFWLTLIAAGMIVFGLAGLVRERRAQRRALRRGAQQAAWEGNLPGQRRGG